MKIFPIACVTAFILSGCAGVIAPFVNNPYAGTYNGMFNASDGRAGTASLQLTNIGNVFGQLDDTATSVMGSMTGSVNTHLVFNGKVSFSTASHNVSGTLTSSGGKISGTLTGSDGYSITLDMNSKS